MSLCILLQATKLNIFEYIGIELHSFLINFLDELGNFKQKKNFTLRNVNFFLHFKATDPIFRMIRYLTMVFLITLEKSINPSST